MLIENGSTPVIMFLMVDATDRSTAETGLSPTVYVSKAGGAFAATTNSATEVSAGWYKVTLTATETGTDGQLALYATGTGAATWREIHQIYTAIPTALASGETVELATAQFAKIADNVLRRNAANIEASSDGDTLAVTSLYGLMQKFMESIISGVTITINESDGATELGTQTVTANASGQITSVTTN